ncbi:unnamed protein product [Boreogadus saida]
MTRHPDDKSPVAADRPGASGWPLSVRGTLPFHQLTADTATKATFWPMPYSNRRHQPDTLTGLPDTLTGLPSDTITTFKSQLKTHLFKLAHNV